MSLPPLAYREDSAAHATPANESVFPYTSIDAPAPPPVNTNRMQQLESMLKEVQGRAEIVEKEAYEKAYLAGEKAGLALGRKRGEQILESLQDTLQEAEANITNIQQGFAEAAIDVAKHIATSIVGDLISKDISRLLDIAQQAAAQLPDPKGLHIAVSPDDYATFNRLFESESELKGDLNNNSESSQNDIQPMPALRRDTNVADGTCRIISSHQDILIDPLAAVTTCLNSVQVELLKPSSPSHPDHMPSDNPSSDPTHDDTPGTSPPHATS